MPPVTANPNTTADQLSLFAQLSLQFLRAIILADDLTGEQVRLAITLLQFINRKRFDHNGRLIAYPGRRRLMCLLGKKSWTLRDLFRALEEIGLLRIYRNGGNGPGDHREYEFDLVWLEKTEASLAAKGALQQWPDKRLPMPKGAEFAHPAEIPHPAENPAVRVRKNLRKSAQFPGHTLSEDQIDTTPSEGAHSCERAASPEGIASRDDGQEKKDAPVLVKKRKQSASDLLEAYKPGPEMARWAKENCPGVDDPCGAARVEHFRDHYRGAGKIPSGDLNALYRSWVRRETKFQGSTRAPSPKSNNAERARSAIAKNILRTREIENVE